MLSNMINLVLKRFWGLYLVLDALIKQWLSQRQCD